MKKYVRDVETESDVGDPRVPSVFAVSSSFANAKSDVESQRDGRSPKRMLVASPEIEK